MPGWWCSYFRIYVFKSMYTHCAGGLITGTILSKILTFKLSSSVYDCHYSDVGGNLNVDKIETVSVPLSLIHQLKYFLLCICTRKNYFLFTKMHLKIYSVKWRPFRLSHWKINGWAEGQIVLSTRIMSPDFLPNKVWFMVFNYCCTALVVTEHPDGWLSISIWETEYHTPGVVKNLGFEICLFQLGNVIKI